MKVKLYSQNIFILYWTFLIVVTSSCSNQSQLSKENQVVHSKTDSKLLKYTTGVRSFLEDSKGNIWFGSYNWYDGNSVKNFTEQDGLESKHIWAIYKSKQGELWFGGANPSGVYLFNGKSFERKF